mmetsp:Transcript_10534/g.12812  ORF Transcript_10534/g.12812 Transcript_10534/m.12812 type:complete len:262 (+) Transcript_10534:61-846(+)
MSQAKPVSEVQEFALMLSHAFCPIMLGLVIWWAKSENTGAMFLGGLGWGTNSAPMYVFNWHPLLMTAGVIAETQALLCFRTWPVTKYINKLIHIFWHIVAVVCFSIGLKSVWRYKNLKLLADLYSLHSWIGILVMALFYGQFLVGFAAYFFPGASAEWRRVYLPLHGFLGVFIFAGFCCSIVLGIVEKTTDQGCGYNTDDDDTKDIDPAEYYTDIYLGCRVSYGLGVCVVLSCMVTLYAVMDMLSSEPPKAKKHDDPEEVL